MNTILFLLIFFYGEFAFYIYLIAGRSPLWLRLLVAILSPLVLLYMIWARLGRKD